MTNPPLTIIGAGPVGLLLACLLGKRGVSVNVYEKRSGFRRASMAIGITPPSLDILGELDLKSAFLRQGVSIARARVFENQKSCGILDFRGSEAEILSFPQFGTERLLRQRLADFPSVHVHEGVEITPESLKALPGWIIACDGAHSPIRRYLGIPMQQKEYGVRFVMADFPDLEDLGPDARLYFSRHGAVESFSLPGQSRRWIAQCVSGAPQDLSTLLTRVQDAAGVDLSDRSPGPICPFAPRRALARTYVKDRFIFCGDAAHVMSPIGGQGMNTGFADALHLSRILPEPDADALCAYTRERQRAFRIAARRAALGMWLGTRSGIPASNLRRNLLRFALRERHVHDSLVQTFAMRNLPTVSSHP
ncbi:MAG: NAD(P)/FAD-dependent oxidoreductase [Kiritimatiellia bacterium]